MLPTGSTRAPISLPHPSFGDLFLGCFSFSASGATILCRNCSLFLVRDPFSGPLYLLWYFYPTVPRRHAFVWTAWGSRLSYKYRFSPGEITPLPLRGTAATTTLLKESPFCLSFST